MSSEDHYQHRDLFKKPTQTYKEIYAMKYSTIHSLPDELFKEVLKRHSHAEIEFDNNPDAIVYTEKNLLEIINFIFENYGRV